MRPRSPSAHTITPTARPSHLVIRCTSAGMSRLGFLVSVGTKQRPIVSAGGNANCVLVRVAHALSTSVGHSQSRVSPASIRNRRTGHLSNYVAVNGLNPRLASIDDGAASVCSVVRSSDGARLSLQARDFAPLSGVGVPQRQHDQKQQSRRGGEDASEHQAPAKSAAAPGPIAPPSANTLVACRRR